MGARYLADTNVIIDLVLGRLPKVCATWLDRRLAAQRVAMSVITRIELLTKTEPVAEYKLMQEFTQSVPVLAFDEPVIWETIKLRQQRKVKKLPDAIIAATASAHGLVLITRNTSDFDSVSEVQLLDLHDEKNLIIPGDIDEEDYF